MYRFTRVIRLRDVEAFETWHNSILISYVIIEDKRRRLNQEEQRLLPYRLMTKKELKKLPNVLYVYIFTQQPLKEQQNNKIIGFIDALLHEVYPTATIIKRITDEKKFSDLPISMKRNDYQKILKMFGSEYKFPNEKNSIYLSQD
ncbi:MAG: hypothetical protein ABS949_10605 [Solibacillus sp.]